MHITYVYDSRNITILQAHKQFRFLFNFLSIKTETPNNCTGSSIVLYNWYEYVNSDSRPKLVLLYSQFSNATSNSNPYWNFIYTQLMDFNISINVDVILRL